jgi:hypothetical protein
MAGCGRTVFLHVASAWRRADPSAWDVDGVLKAIEAFVPARAAEVVPEPLPPQAIDHPFAPGDEGFWATATLRDWVIDDVAWLIEVVAYACHENGIQRDVLISARSAVQEEETLDAG